jgi:hypothetical protein
LVALIYPAQWIPQFDSEPRRGVGDGIDHLPHHGVEFGSVTSHELFKHGCT